MTAIYKRELKSYLTSMVGYLFIFFILVLTGIYFSAYQLSAAYPKFEYTLSAVTFVFLIGVPILTMRVLAEERKQKTDQLLLTAPVSVGNIVIGKYLALVTVYAIPILVMCTDRKPGHCSSTYICTFVCFLYDEWYFFLFLQNIYVYLRYFWIADSGSSDHSLYDDQKCTDFSNCSCNRRSNSCCYICS